MQFPSRWWGVLALGLAGPLRAQAQARLGFTLADTRDVAGFEPRRTIDADVDLDGDLDLVVTAGGDDQGSEVNVFLGAGDGTFPTRRIVVGGTKPWGVAAGDLDGDGVLDLALTQARQILVTPDPLCGANAGVAVFHGRGDGGFDFLLCLQAGVAPVGVVLEDLDADGDLDLVSAASAGGGLMAFLGAGNGSFSGPLPVAGATQLAARDLAAADLDLDGVVDLVAAHGFGARVLLGLGAASFQYAGDAGPFEAAEAVDLADVTGDGYPDVVTAHPGSGRVGIAPSQGGATFSGARTTAVGSDVLDVALADLDQDGLVDVAAAVGSSLVGLVSSGGGGVRLPKYWPVDPQARSVAAGDFDGDGWPDAAVASLNVDAPSLTVYRNDRLRGPWVHVPGGVGGPVLTANGRCTVGSQAVFHVQGAPPGVGWIALIGTSRLDLAWLGQTVIPRPETVVFGLVTDPLGEARIAARVPLDARPGTTYWFQGWFLDAASPTGWTATNGLGGTVGSAGSIGRP